ncbi:MAG: ABC transporter ATP-binding protein [Spirochaetaceae bacterium]|jgi:oligopeptide/dipeptide ABC transporter ATP-binding protein|nr:ABC transporter ATP-binding protein [Spirochaetaceae bacterium]
MEKIIEAKNVTVGFTIEGKLKRIVYGVDFQVYRGEVLTILGESGCGKSVIGSAIVKLLPYNAVVGGALYYNGIDILGMDEQPFRTLRGKDIAVALQGGESGLDPLVQIGFQSAEGIMYHERLPFIAALSRVKNMFVRLGLKEPETLARRYPYQLSGGMNQRVLLGMSALLQPKFLLLDEPTKGLDAVSKQDTVQAIQKLRSETQSAILLITHDLDLAYAISDRIMVMYAGQIIEILSPAEMKTPQHPYTAALTASAPEGGFTPIPGYAPDSLTMPQGCHFSPRCAFVQKRCMTEIPEITAAHNGMVRCFYPMQAERGQYAVGS